MKPKAIIEEVNNYLNPMVPVLLSDWLPGGRFVGAEYQCANIDGGEGKSLRYNSETGVGRDFAGTEKGWNDPVSFWALKWNVKQSEAARKLADQYSIRIPDKAPPQKNGDRFSHIWEKASPVNGDDHPYLKKKGVKSYGLRVVTDGYFKGWLLVPVFNARNDLVGLKRIAPDGKEKKFFKGTKKRGNFFVIPGEGDSIHFAEGYATGASVHEAAGATVVICFDAGNLDSVICAHRAADQEGAFTVCADNDAFKEENKGVMAATKAAKKYRCNVCIPQFRNVETKPTDFNDLHQLEGIDEVRRQLRNPQIDTQILAAFVSEEEEKRGPSDKDLLIDIGIQGELFQSDEEPYVTYRLNAHHETWPLKSSHFEKHLRLSFFNATKKACNTNSYKECLDHLNAVAFSGDEKKVWRRVGEAGGKIYIDLCNDAWEVVEVDADGWRLLKESPIKFIRSKAMQSLPKPVKGPDGWGRLRKYFNLKPAEDGNDDFILIAAFIIGAFHPGNGYVILIFRGGEGTAKSSATNTVKKNIDPNLAPLRGMPDSVRDLMISARNSYCLAYDNLSGISPALSDALCTISTGGGYAGRTLFTNADESVFSVRNPVILNGMDDLTSRHDLSDRAVTVELEPIPEGMRKSEAELQAQFNKDHPVIFGAVCDALSGALRCQDDVKLGSLPRMADFAKWVNAACLSGSFCCSQDDFNNAYEANRRGQIEGALGGTLVEQALIRFVEVQYQLPWSGTPTQLYEKLTDLNKSDAATDANGNVIKPAEKFSKDRRWPSHANKLSGEINRAKRVLYEIKGIKIENRSRRIDGNVKRIISISKI